MAVKMLQRETLTSEGNTCANFSCNSLRGPLTNCQNFYNDIYIFGNLSTSEINVVLLKHMIMKSKS